MTSLAIILGFAAIHLAASAGPIQPLPPALCAACTLSVMLIIWFGASWRIARALRALDKTGKAVHARNADKWATRARRAEVAAFFVATIFLGWLDAVRSVTGDLLLIDELLALAPLPLALIAIAWSIAPLARRLKEASVVRDLDEGKPIEPIPRRSGWVMLAVRTQVLVSLVPLSILSLWSEYAERLRIDPPSWAPDWLTTEIGYTGAVILGVLCLFAISPILLAQLLDTAPLGPGPIRDRIRAIAKRHKVPLGRILVWRTHGTIPNAAAAGIAPPLRFVMFSDALLDALTEDEIEAVAAHEAAHLKRRHIFWMGAVLMVVLSAASLAAVFIAPLVGLAPGVQTEVASAAAALPLALITFGFVSRRFEWQSDAFTVTHFARAREADTIEQQDTEHIASALLRIASLTATDPDRPSWRHGSISTRIRKARALIHRDPRDIPQDRSAATIKIITTILGLAVIAILVGLTIIEESA